VRWNLHTLDCQTLIQVLAELEVGSVASDPLQAGALATGLRFFCIAGWGWVAEIGGRIAGSAHPLEKTATSFMNASIHRLFYWQVNLREFGASSLR
jgi:hypothetical protein